MLFKNPIEIKGVIPKVLGDLRIAQFSVKILLNEQKNFLHDSRRRPPGCIRVSGKITQDFFHKSRRKPVGIGRRIGIMQQTFLHLTFDLKCIFNANKIFQLRGRIVFKNKLRIKVTQAFNGAARPRPMGLISCHIKIQHDSLHPSPKGIEHPGAKIQQSSRGKRHGF